LLPKLLLLDREEKLSPLLWFRVKESMGVDVRVS
jgi:hypothetical protein